MRDLSMRNVMSVKHKSHVCFFPRVTYALRIPSTQCVPRAIKRAVLISVVSLFSVLAYAVDLPLGYGGVTLGMKFDDVKAALEKNREFGYNGPRDVSLLPGENRALIETDAKAHHVYSFLDRCFFQFADDTLEAIIVNFNQDIMDHYSIFSTLCEKYGDPDSLSPQKSVWKNDSVVMSLERPLTLKYVDADSMTKQGEAASLSGHEMTRESFLSGL